MVIVPSNYVIKAYLFTEGVSNRLLVFRLFPQPIQPPLRIVNFREVISNPKYVETSLVESIF